MSLRMKFADLLTFLSFKSSPNKLIRVLFSYGSQNGEMAFKDGELWELRFPNMHTDPAINFLHERKIVIKEIKELLPGNTIEALSNLISGFSREFIIYHAQEGELTWEISSEELKDFYLRSKKKILENLKNKTDIVWLENDENPGIYALKLKKELVVFSFFSSSASAREEFFNSTPPFLRELSKITSECVLE